MSIEQPFQFLIIHLNHFSSCFFRSLVFPNLFFPYYFFYRTVQSLGCKINCLVYLRGEAGVKAIKYLRHDEHDVLVEEVIGQVGQPDVVPVTMD